MGTVINLTKSYVNKTFFEAGGIAADYAYASSNGASSNAALGDYFTKYQLTTEGVLDVRYYTETEIDQWVNQAVLTTSTPQFDGVYSDNFGLYSI